MSDSEDIISIIVIAILIFILGSIFGGIHADDDNEITTQHVITYIETLKKYNTVDLTSVNDTLENDEIIAWGETTKVRNKDV